MTANHLPSKGKLKTIPNSQFKSLLPLFFLLSLSESNGKSQYFPISPLLTLSSMCWSPISIQMGIITNCHYYTGGCYLEIGYSAALFFNKESWLLVKNGKNGWSRFCPEKVSVHELGKNMLDIHKLAFAWGVLWIYTQAEYNKGTFLLHTTFVLHCGTRSIFCLCVPLNSFSFFSPKKWAF